MKVFMLPNSPPEHIMVKEADHFETISVYYTDKYTKPHLLARIDASFSGSPIFGFICIDLPMEVPMYSNINPDEAITSALANRHVAVGTHTKNSQ